MHFAKAIPIKHKQSGRQLKKLCLTEVDNSIDIFLGLK